MKMSASVILEVIYFPWDPKFPNSNLIDFDRFFQDVRSPEHFDILPAESWDYQINKSKEIYD